MRRRATALTAALLAAAALAGCDGSSPTDPMSVRQDSPWTVTRGSSSVLGPLTPAGDGSHSFGFPAGPSDSVNYVLRGAGRVAPGGTLSVTFRVDSAAGTVYAALSGGTSAHATLYLERRGTGYTAGEASNRWWAGGQRYRLGSGDNAAVTISVPLVADAWTNVYGQRDQAAFDATLSNLGALGITFGGVSDYGHGVNLASGSARFVILGADY